MKKIRCSVKNQKQREKIKRKRCRNRKDNLTMRTTISDEMRSVNFIPVEARSSFSDAKESIVSKAYVPEVFNAVIRYNREKYKPTIKPKKSRCNRGGAMLNEALYKHKRVNTLARLIAIVLFLIYTSIVMGNRAIKASAMTVALETTSQSEVVASTNTKGNGAVVILRDVKAEDVIEAESFESASVQQSNATSKEKTYDDWLEIADERALEWYIPDIHLEYEDEELNMPYKHQRHVWVLCQMKGIDYWDVMAIIARESRFDANATTGSHIGYMQIGVDPATDMKKRLNDYSLDRNNIYDNITLGIELYVDCLERTNYNTYDANWAYATGYWGYLSQVRNGRTSNSDADKAIKFRRLLTDETLNPRSEK